MHKYRYLVGLLASAALVGPAFADAAPDKRTGVEATRTTNDAPGDIVVTATRQRQLLSQVPISLSAFSQKTLDVKGIKTFADVTKFTPGVQFDPVGNQISIRGISSTAGAGTTGIYIDDTPIQVRNLGFSSDNSLPAIFDLDRVEVLRGPQGTLFGAGSEGGTVRYITPQPSLKDWGTYERAEISDTKHGAVSGEVGSAVGGPIIEDRLGVRVSAWHRRDGGFIDHVATESGDVDAHNINHGDVTVIRGALAWQPTEGVLVTPAVLYQRRTTNASDIYYPSISDNGSGNFRTSSPEYRGSKDRYVLPTLNIRYDTSYLTVVSNSSYFSRVNDTGYDGTIYNLSFYQGCYLDGCGFASGGVNGGFYPFLTPRGVNPTLPYYLSPSRVSNVQKVFTQELRLQSRESATRLNWVIGVFYEHSRQRSTEELVDPLGNSFFDAVFGESLEDFFGYPQYKGRDSYINNSNAIDSQVAVFGDATYRLFSGLKLDIGGRVERTKYSFTSFADGSQNSSRTSGSGSTKQYPFTPKVALNWQIDRNSLIYANWSKGFRNGGANSPVPLAVCSADLDALGLQAAPDTYRSDTVRSIEVGSKNKLFGNKLQLAGSLYQIRWDNIQQSVYLPSCGISFTGNLGKARSRGFDLQFTVLPLRGFTVDGSLGYTDAHYTSSVLLGSGSVVVRKGDAIGGSPWTIALGAQYDFSVAEHDLYLRSDVEYASRLNRLTASQDPEAQAYDPTALPDSARTMVSLRAGAVFAGASISVFVDNLLNSEPRIDYNHADLNTLLFQQSAARPRTIGLTLTYRQ